MAVPLLATLPTLAELGRSIPEDARRGRMTHASGMNARLDGREVLLAPGAQIRSEQNLVIVPTALAPDSLVKYQTDANGQISRVWVLSREEAARPDKRRSK